MSLIKFTVTEKAIDFPMPTHRWVWQRGREPVNWQPDAHPNYADPIDLSDPFPVGGWFTKIAVLALGSFVVGCADDGSLALSVANVVSN